MNKRRINVGELIVHEIYECAKKNSGPLFFPSLITALCTAAAVPMIEIDEYTQQRSGWDMDDILEIMQVKAVDPLQATPGASQSTAVPPTPQSAAPADPYHQILQKLEAMELRQKQYMEYSRNFNTALGRLMHNQFPDSPVQFPEFPANIFASAAAPQPEPYTEATPAPAASRRPFPSYYATGTTASAASVSRSQRQGKAAAVSPIRIPTDYATWPPEVQELYPEYKTSAPAEPVEIASDSEEQSEADDTDDSEEDAAAGDTEQLSSAEEEPGEEVTAPVQQTPPSRIQPSRQAKQSPGQSQKKKRKIIWSESEDF